MWIRFVLNLVLLFSLAVVVSPAQEQTSLVLPEETHLRNVKQLTFGGENAEAYFSADDRFLILQASGKDFPCDQIFTLSLEPAKEGQTSQPRLVSTGKGKTTCAYFFPSRERILYSSTHLGSTECPPSPDYSQGYVWPLFGDYDIFTARPDGSDLKRLTSAPGYDAEATVSPDGSKVVFTSMRDGDLDIYTMNTDGTDVRRLTDRLGYDGGAFFSPDGSQIVYRAHHPEDPEEIAGYKRLLAQNLIRPGTLEIRVMDADGSDKRQITQNGAANFAPFWHPDGKRIIFASNLSNPQGRNFDLYLIHLDGTGLERVTFHQEFDGFPMFSSDGRRLVWASNRNNRQPGETNIFLADWVE